MMSNVLNSVNLQRFEHVHGTHKPTQQSPTLPWNGTRHGLSQTSPVHMDDMSRGFATASMLENRSMMPR